MPAHAGRTSSRHCSRTATIQSVSGTVSTVRRFGALPCDDIPQRTNTLPPRPNVGTFGLCRRSARSSPRPRGAAIRTHTTSSTAAGTVGSDTADPDAAIRIAGPDDDLAVKPRATSPACTFGSTTGRQPASIPRAPQLSRQWTLRIAPTPAAAVGDSTRACGSSSRPPSAREPSSVSVPDTDDAACSSLRYRRTSFTLDPPSWAILATVSPRSRILAKARAPSNRCSARRCSASSRTSSCRSASHSLTAPTFCSATRNATMSSPLSDSRCRRSRFTCACASRTLRRTSCLDSIWAIWRTYVWSARER